MAFNTNIIRSSLLQSSPANPAYFEVRFNGMPKIFEGNSSGVIDSIETRKGRQGKWEDNFQDFRYRCTDAELPARQLMTQERRYVGPQRLLPYGILYGTLNLNLIEGKNIRMRELFDTWQDSVFSGANYRPHYYDDVICDMTIDVYDKSGNKVREYLLKECFPVSVNPSQLSWSGNSQIMTVPIEIAYHEFIGKSTWINKGQAGSDFTKN